MNTQTFWGVIGNYNSQTWMMQAVLFVLIILGIILSYIGKVKWAAKLSLGIANLFIGVAFYVCYGTEPVQQYFALLMIWGLTGVKSAMFNVCEDVILLICGIYGVVLFINEFRKQKSV